MRENGFVSMLTAILFSLLLLALTVGLVGVQTLSLRKASDNEQSQKAYFGAESGVEDAIAKIRSGLVSAALPQASCQGYSTADVSWSCQTINFSNPPFGIIARPDSALTIKPTSGSAGISSLTIQWDQGTINSGSATEFLPSTYISGLPQPLSGSWGTYPMPLELTVVTYPSGSLTTSAIATHNFFLNPNRGVPGTGAWGSGSSQDANCTVAGTTDTYGGTGKYHCTFKLTGLPTNRLKLFRLESRYVGDTQVADHTHTGQFAMTFFDQFGAYLPLNTGTATIDVTGQSGDVYRRVIYTLPTSANAGSLLNSALQSDATVCKDFSVVSGAPKLSGPCPGGDF